MSFVCDVNGWSFVKNSRYVSCRSTMFSLITSRKYYDDCAQIMSEHILAAIKPEALTAFSTLDPLLTTALNRMEEPIVEERKTFQIIERATRLLNAQTSNLSDERETEHGSLIGQTSIDGARSPTRTPDNDSVLATTLNEGALPVRQFSNMLMSEPASIAHSANSSVTSDYTDRQSLTHREELRCVVAITRHGDRTPKVR